MAKAPSTQDLVRRARALWQEIRSTERKLALSQWDQRAIQAAVGHPNLSTTSRYLHLTPTARGDAIRLLDATPTPARAAVANG